MAENQQLSLTTHSHASLWSRMLTALRGRGTPEFGEQYAEPAGGAALSTTNGARRIAVSDERAMGVSAVWSAGRLIAEIVGTMPLEVFRRKEGPGGDVLQKKHWLTQLLISPNAWMTCQEFKEFSTLCMVWWGNSYSGIIRDNNGIPSSLIPLRPEKMKVVRTEDGDVGYFYETPGQGFARIKSEDVLHLKSFGDGWVGFSVLGYARHAMGVAVAAEEYSNQFFANDAKQAGVLSVDRILKGDQRKNVAESFKGLVENSDERLFVLEADMKFQPLTLPPTDAQFIEQRRFGVAEVARFFRVPPHMLFETDKSTSWGTGLHEQSQAFLRYTLEPYLTRWEQGISKRLIPALERRKIYAKHNTKEMERADPKSRGEYIRNAIQSGWMTPNEGRALENLPPHEHPAANELHMQGAMLPIGQLQGDNGDALQEPDAAADAT